jgi:protein SCO1/2
MLLVQPLVLGTVIAGVWWRPLRRVVRGRPRALFPVAAAALFLVATTGAGFATVSPGTTTGELPFPADGLRTALLPPDFALIDHTGAPVRLAELRGRVVLVTAVYATCGYTCPMILGQTKGAVATLTPEERADLTVVGITLDPAHDTPDVLARMAQGQGVAPPLYHLVTGDPAQVDRVLDDFSVARARDPKTGVIDHANLFILIDRGGHIAYRFTLGERQARWLGEGLKTLLREPAPPRG